jgi:hypothetical protein
MPRKPIKAKFPVELQAASLVAAAKLVVPQLRGGTSVPSPEQKIAETAVEILCRFTEEMQSLD